MPPVCGARGGSMHSFDVNALTRDVYMTDTMFMNFSISYISYSVAAP